MRLWLRAGRGALALGGIMLASTVVQGMQPQGSSPAAELAGKARALELRGRSELARQTWQQMLQQEPENSDALKGLIRTSEATGHSAEAETYLQRLRAAHPDDPSLPQLSRHTSGNGDKEAQLRQAEQLARQGKYSDAVAAYRKLYGAEPPPGDIALHYYTAEGATEAGRPEAIASLRALVDRFPEEGRYRKALGALLVLNARTKQEGEKLLGGSPPERQTATVSLPSLPGAAQHREAPAREVATKESAPLARASTPAEHSSERASAPEVNPSRPAPLLLGRSMPPPVVQASVRPPKSSQPASLSRVTVSEGTVSQAAPLTTASAVSGAASRANAEEERAGLAALNAGRLREAEARFKVLLARDPANGRALGGLGLLRLRQGQREQAARLLEAAQQNGVSDPAILRGLQQAGVPAGALPKAGEHREPLQVASARHEPEPQRAFGASSATVRPLAALAQTTAADTGAALIPQPEAVVSSPAPRVPLATNSPDHNLVPARASAPAPAAAGDEVERAARLAGSGDTTGAEQLYRQVLAATPGRAAAWSGLITLQHTQSRDAAAQQTLDQMPAPVLHAALNDQAFSLTVASIEASQGRTAAARQVLQDLLSRAPQPPGPTYGLAQLQFAGLLLNEGQSAQAYALFRTALGNGQFENAQAWAGLLASLHASGHDREALAQAEQAPVPVRQQLESNPLFLETEAMIYAGLNDGPHALSAWNRLQQAGPANGSVPAGASVEFARWLSGRGDEAVLYPVLMRLGSRTDLSDEQRRTVQRIWANWAVRQAVGQARTGNLERAKLTLSTATATFFDNPEALRSLAGGYAAINQPKTAVAMFRAQDLSAASAEDMAAAVNAALAVRDMKAAEMWLRSGLLRYRRDANLLLLASRYEQQTGHKQESAAYLQAAVSLGPSPSLTGISPNPAAGTQVASAEPAGGTSPDLSALFLRARPADKPKTNPPVPEGAGRPYLPSFDQAGTTTGSPR